MKRILFLLFISVLTTSAAYAADPTDTGDDILAQRGKGFVTQKAFSARADRIPAEMRREALRDGNRLRDVINTLLLRAQLAADAREAGFDKQDLVKERMRLAADAELGQAWLQYYVETQPAADYETLARESYLLNKDKMLSPEKIDVSHILISIKERSYAEAKVIADKVKQLLDKDPASFDELVSQYSEDPSASANHGKFKGVGKGDMVKPFEQAAFALSDGEISDPVKTQYGYHIIRRDAIIPRTPQEFAAVKDQLIAAERKRHEGRIESDYLQNLSSLDIQMTQEALEELVRRLFGEDYVNPEADDGAEARQHAEH